MEPLILFLQFLEDYLYQQKIPVMILSLGLPTPLGKNGRGYLKLDLNSGVSV